MIQQGKIYVPLHALETIVIVTTLQENAFQYVQQATKHLVIKMGMPVFIDVLIRLLLKMTQIEDVSLDAIQLLGETR